MAPEAIKAIEHNIFTPGNYFYNGVGHVTVKYEEVLAIGYEGIMQKPRRSWTDVRWATAIMQEDPTF